MPDHVFQCYLTRELRSLGLSGSEAWVRIGDELRRRKALAPGRLAAVAPAARNRRNKEATR